MTTEVNNVLSVRNSHPRDENIQFFEDGHKYCIAFEPDIQYTSVTTWNHQHFEQFDADKVINKMMRGAAWKEGHKYWGNSPEEIKDLWNTNKNSVSGAGTDLHFEIECFHNDKRLQFEYMNKELYQFYIGNYEKNLPEKPIEWQYFINFICDNQNLKPYRTEWTVYNEDVKIAGSIDMVYENPDGTLSIYDWKRCKNITRINTFNKFATTPLICHLPDSNFWHYALQLNTYKYILETKYDKKIRDLYLVRLHPDAQEKNYELIPLPDLSNELKELFEEKIKNLYSENT
jgi:ATP-dependent exoDNAse (exonuclease V) beta subunit